MSRSRFARGVAATVLLASIAACGRSTTPGSPSPPAAYPNISIVGVTVAGERAAGGYVYRVVATMRETAGVAATIAAVDLTFLKGTTVVVSSHEDRPISDSSNICPGGATVASRELIARDTSAHEFADVVRVAVSYADAGSFSAIANSSAAVPPLPAAPESTVYTLSGFINDFDSRLPIANARVEVLNGSNAGKASTTDAAGAYLLTGLTAATFRMRASADGYDAGEQNVAVPDISRADMSLRRSAPTTCTYAVSRSSDGSLPFAGGQFTLSITRLSGTCGWQAISNAAWMSVANPSGNGTASLVVTYQPNTSFIGRNGSITVQWVSGQTEIFVGQVPEPAFCRVVTLTVGGQSTISAPATGGRYTAAIVPEPGTLPGLCGGWTASGSVGITFVGPTSGPNLPSTVTFDVEPNTAPSGRTLNVTVTVKGPLLLLINQAAP
jgi:Carboxypeptidase regulatory-like domain/Putative binding domain, N-terminal